MRDIVTHLTQKHVITPGDRLVQQPMLSLGGRKLSQISYPEDVLLYLDLEECLGLCQDKRRYRAFYAEGTHVHDTHS